jgi:hypothetical protein
MGSPRLRYWRLFRRPAQRCKRGYRRDIHTEQQISRRFPTSRPGGYSLLDVDATYAFPKSLELSLGFKDVLDDYYELAWGFPQRAARFM